MNGRCGSGFLEHPVNVQAAVRGRVPQRVRAQPVAAHNTNGGVVVHVQSDETAAHGLKRPADTAALIPRREAVFWEDGVEQSGDGLDTLPCLRHHVGRAVQVVGPPVLLARLAVALEPARRGGLEGDFDAGWEGAFQLDAHGAGDAREALVGCGFNCHRIAPKAAQVPRRNPAP